MKTREKAKEQTIKLIEQNIDRYNELNHTSHNKIWIEVYPDGNVYETEEASNNTYHMINDKKVANVLDIAKCEYCDCDACVSWRDAHDTEVTEEEFKTRWHYEKSDVGENFANHLKNYEYYDYEMADRAAEAIDGIEYGYFDDEQ